AGAGGLSAKLKGVSRGAGLATVDNVQVLQQRLEFEQKLVALVDRIHAARNLDAIFIECRDEMLALFDADRLTLYAVDAEKKEIYSKFLDLDTVREIRVPISPNSLTGFAVLNRQIVNIEDAYDTAELARISTSLHFDSSFDKRTGFRTTQVLVIPIVHDSRTVVGALQMLNKRHALRFTKEDEVNLARVAKTLAIATRSEEHTSELQSLRHLVCRLLLEKKKRNKHIICYSMNYGKTDVG